MAEATSNSDRIPKRSSDGFACPRCGVFAHQAWFPLYRELEDYGNTYTEAASDSKTVLVAAVANSTVAPSATIPMDVWGAPSMEAMSVVPAESLWAMSKCGRCDEYSTWRGDVLVFPAGSSFAPLPHEDMPDAAKELYREAASVVGISRRAGTALARAALESALKALDTQNGRVNLATRIDRAQPRVSVSLFQMLTIIRHAGNQSLHAGDELDEVMTLVLDPEQEEIVELIFAAVNELAEELVTKPRRAQEMFDKLPDRIRESVGKPPKSE